jgi:hypothetical protein
MTTLVETRRIGAAAAARRRVADGPAAALAA